ncbi:MAG: outer membrane lipoprotein carrier protein LolA [Cystobacterineae bacterium]|nr:outer membrane lipoprotein carrier protein LolA [Cystobacterineae bacterium]
MPAQPKPPAQAGTQTPTGTQTQASPSAQVEPPLQAKEEIFSHPLSAQTQPRFLQVCQAMAQHKVLKGAFVQTNHLSRLGRSLVSQGFFAIDIQRGMVWDTRIPFPSLTAVGKDFVVQSSGGRTTRMDASGNETFIRISQTMSTLFGGNAQILSQSFELYFIEKDGMWHLGLLPKESTLKAFVKAIVMRGNAVLRQVVFYEHNGNSIVYELYNHSFPAELSVDEKALFAP